MTALEAPSHPRKRSRGPGWSNEEKEALRGLVAQGKTFQQISRELGRQAYSCSQHAKRLGIKRPPKPQKELPVVQPRPLVGSAIDAACRFYSIPRTELISEHRDRTSIRRRHIAFYVASKVTRVGDTKLGRLVRRDRTTVMNSRLVIEGLLAAGD